MITINGNGLVPAGDMISRVLECRLVIPDNVNLVTRKFYHPNLAQWTRQNRGDIVGALVCIMQQETDKIIGSRFPEWMRSVADKFVAVSDVSDLTDDWIEAGNDDASGIGSDNLHALMTKMATAKWEIKGWITAAEWVQWLSANAQTEMMAIFKNVVVSEREFVAYLRHYQNVKHGNIRLQGKKMNLRDRTDHKARWCFYMNPADDRR